MPQETSKLWHTHRAALKTDQTVQLVCFVGLTLRINIKGPTPLENHTIIKHTSALPLKWCFIGGPQSCLLGIGFHYSFTPHKQRLWMPLKCKILENIMKTGTFAPHFHNIFKTIEM